MIHVLHLPAQSAFRWVRRIKYALHLSRTRKMLARLDAHLLSDLGLTHEEAEREAVRRAWDPPGHWLE